MAIEVMRSRGLEGKIEASCSLHLTATVPSNLACDMSVTRIAFECEASGVGRRPMRSQGGVKSAPSVSPCDCDPWSNDVHQRPGPRLQGDLPRVG